MEPVQDVYRKNPIIKGEYTHKRKLDMKEQINRDQNKNEDFNIKNRDRDLMLKKEDVEKFLEELNKISQDNETYFEFKIHEPTGRIIYKLFESETDEIIKEIPTEKILDIMAGICQMAGVVIDKKA